MSFHLAAWPFTAARGGRRWNVLDLVAIARDHGFAGIEVDSRRLAALGGPGIDRFARELMARECAILLDVDCDLSTADDEARARAITAVIDALAVAAAVGARIARITLGGQRLSIGRLSRPQGGAGTRPAAASRSPLAALLRIPLVLHLAHRMRRALPARIGDLDARVERAVEALQPLCRVAADRGVTLAIENHWGISSFPEVIVAVIERVGAGNLGACIDFGNFPRNVPTAAGIRRLLPHARIVQVKTLSLNRHGTERLVDVAGCCALVADAAYQGPVTVEYGGLGDPLAGSLATLRLARRCLDRGRHAGT